MKIIFSILSFSLFCSTSFAQVAAYRDIGWFKNDVYVDGKKIDMDFNGGHDLRAAMKGNALAFKFAENANCYHNWGSGLFWTGLAGYVYFLNNRSMSYESRSWNAVYFLTLIIPATFFQFAGQLNENRAINAYNGVKVANTDLIPSVSLMPVAGGGGGLLTWSF